MSNTKRVNVKLITTNDISKIEVNYGLNKDIKVYLNTLFSMPYNILQDYIYIVKNHIVQSFDSSNDIPNDWINLFWSVNTTDNNYLNTRPISYTRDIFTIPIIDDEKTETSINPISIFTSLINNSSSLTSQPAPSINRNHSSMMSNDIIKGLAGTVFKIINEKMINPPDFSSTTRVGYKKIKNFVHNLTKIWLHKNEIDVFVNEINRLSTDYNTQ